MEKELFPTLKDGDSHSELLDEFITRLTALRDQIPESKRAEAFVYFSCHGDYASTYANLTY